jgi:hypothetical protein
MMPAGKFPIPVISDCRSGAFGVVKLSGSGAGSSVEWVADRTGNHGFASPRLPNPRGASHTNAGKSVNVTAPTADDDNDLREELEQRMDWFRFVDIHGMLRGRGHRGGIGNRCRIRHCCATIWIRIRGRVVAFVFLLIVIGKI